MPSPEAPSPKAARPWWWTGSLLSLAAATGMYLFAPTEADPDLWGHLRFGLDLLDTGRIVRADTYSYLTGDQRWINHEWLSEAIMAIAFRAGGAPGLIAIKMAIGLAVAALLVWHLRRVGITLLASLLIVAYGVAVMLPGFRSLRPQAFTYLAFLIILLLIHADSAPAERGREIKARGLTLRARAVWLAPVVLAIWANLHGGFVVGLGVLTLWAVVSTAARGGVLTPWLLVAVACAATLLNPYGAGLWTFLWRTLGPRPDIAEWQALSLVTTEGAAYLAVLLFGAVGFIGMWRSRRWVALALFVAGAMLPFLARRHLPLFVLITIVMCAEAAAGAIGSFVRRRWPGEARASSDRFRPVVGLALLFQAVVLFALAMPQLAWIRVKAADYPVAATTWLARSGVAANVAVDFDWGEYVIWHAGPRVKVSVDGRRETVYSDATYEENRRLTAGADDWDRLLTRRPTDLALVSVRTPVFALLARRADWVLLMHDDTTGLFGRRDAGVTAMMRATPPPAVDPRRASIFP